MLTVGSVTAGLFVKGVCTSGGVTSSEVTGTPKGAVAGKETFGELVVTALNVLPVGAVDSGCCVVETSPHPATTITAITLHSTKRITDITGVAGVTDT